MVFPGWPTCGPSPGRRPPASRGSRPCCWWLGRPAPARRPPPASTPCPPALSLKTERTLCNCSVIRDNQVWLVRRVGIMGSILVIHFDPAFQEKLHCIDYFWVWIVGVPDYRLPLHCTTLLSGRPVRPLSRSSLDWGSHYTTLQWSTRPASTSGQLQLVTVLTTSQLSY